MKYIFGLGNPDRKYQLTRHNIGFQFVEYLSKKYSGSNWKDDLSLKSLTTDILLDNEKCQLIKPQTYMNLSGEAVAKVVNYYKINLTDILIVHDDFDLPFGSVKLRLKGEGRSAHNGIRSIVAALGNSEFARLRIGMGNELMNTIGKENFVLTQFPSNEREQLEDLFYKAELLILQWLKERL